MVPVELVRGSTARALISGRGGDAELLTAMWSNLPDGGIAEAKLRGRHPVQPASYRLLNGRILEHALGFLDDDLSTLFLDGLSKYRALTRAAADSLADPKQAEVLVTLIEPYKITSSHEPYIALVANGVELERVVFEITLAFGMGQTALVIRRGAIEEVECEACSIGITLALRNWPQPLLQRTIPLRVRLPVRPPIPIPLPRG